jgi:CheY-like chemotaxis protein
MRELPVESAARADLETVIQASMQARDLVRQILAFSRKQDIVKQPADLVDVTREALQMLRASIPRTVELVENFAAVPPLLADAGQLHQVIINLVSNAAHAIGDHIGRITVSIAPAGLRPNEAGTAIGLTISDTGCGMDEATTHRIFEPFYTTKPVGEGTGLGLAICHGIVSALGGTLSVQSAVGIGTMFRVVLPVAKGEGTEAHFTARAALRPALRGRVLIIDDEKDLTDVTSEGLSDLHDVQVTQDARQALEWISGGARFDLILCDMMMPLMTGMEFHTRLAALDPQQADRVVFMTGGAFTPRAREFLARLPNLRLEKPFDLGHILAMVSAHLESASMTGALKAGSTSIQSARS